MTWALSALLLAIGSYALLEDKAYTYVTFLTTGIFIPLLRFVFKVNWLDKILAVYPVLLIPFFIVNGILTGTGLEEPVVWYDNAENLGIRMGTIPVEDVFYGLELILLTLFFFYTFKRKHHVQAA
jgi:lycopene cyclase domain-containing protein